MNGAPPINFETPIPEEPAFLALVRRAGLSALNADASLAEVSVCLAKLESLARGADARTLALVRQEAIRLVKATRAADAPAQLVDAHLN
jgi:hypothetical protein